MIRDDGEWISGYYYFYLNYSPILLAEVVDEEFRDEESDAIRADREVEFPWVWDGDYLYFHYIEQAEAKGKYGNLLKTRGRGFSYKSAAMLARNAVMYPKSKNYAMASETEFLTKDAILNKAWDVLDWCAANTPWPRLRLIDQMMHKKLGYKDKKLGIERGFKSEIIGVTTKDNPDKARGKRGKLILLEESGKFPGLKKVWSIARPSMEQGRRVFGMMIAGGTGGTLGADFEAAEEFFYYPVGYRIHELPNMWDKVRGKGTCSFFFPEYVNREDCYDKNGNSDIISALIQIFEDRLNIKYNTSDPHALTQEKADRPITPQEAVMRVEGTLFPIADLKDYLADVMPTIESFISPHYIGRLAIQNQAMSWVPDPSIHIIREFPIKDNVDKTGGVEIYEMPKTGSAKKPPMWRYIAGIDPYDDDHSTTNSLGSIFIMDTFTDRIVAEYTGRPRLANEFYEQCARLLEFYNAIANYENDKKGLYAYFSQKNILYRLCKTPEILKDMNMVVTPGYGNKAVGTNSGKRINQWGRRLQADWMLSIAYGTQDEDNVPFMNLQKCRSIGYIKEAVAWNPDGNFDRISAMGMLMILREDIRKYTDVRKSEGDSQEVEDPFFARNYTQISFMEESGDGEEKEEYDDHFNATYKYFMYKQGAKRHQVEKIRRPNW